MKTILIIENDPDILEFERMVLEREGFVVFACTDATTAIHVVSRDRVDPDMIVLDYMLPDMSGGELLTKLKACLQKATPTLFATGSEPGHITALMGVRNLLQKPFTWEKFVARVRAALEEPVSSPA